jgi:hypothetical protein
MRPSIILFALVMTAAVSICEAAEKHFYDNLISAPPLPEGYTMRSLEIKDGERKLGTRLILIDKTERPKIVITVEQRELPSERHKMASLKAYINSVAVQCRTAGFKLVTQEIPDITKIDFSKQTTAKFTYDKPDKSRVVVGARAFFTNIGYCVYVFADDEDEFKQLSAWAASIQEDKGPVDKSRSTPTNTDKEN